MNNFKPTPQARQVSIYGEGAEFSAWKKGKVKQGGCRPLSEVTCYNFQKKGHYSRNFLEPKHEINNNTKGFQESGVTKAK